jgi:hypothetical protein
MKQYEYNVITNETFLNERLLNKLGMEGWSLSSHTYSHFPHTPDRHVYTFKREKVSPQDTPAIEDRIKAIDKEIKEREQEIANAILRHKVWTRQIG